MRRNNLITAKVNDYELALANKLIEKHGLNCVGELVRALIRAAAVQEQIAVGGELAGGAVSTNRVSRDAKVLG